MRNFLVYLLEMSNLRLLPGRRALCLSIGGSVMNGPSLNEVSHQTGKVGAETKVVRAALLKSREGGN